MSDFYSIAATTDDVDIRDLLYDLGYKYDLEFDFDDDYQGEEVAVAWWHKYGSEMYAQHGLDYLRRYLKLDGGAS